MKIGIDISQTAYENTGVANYLEQLLAGLSKLNNGDEYILFASSFRQSIKYKVLSIKYKNSNNIRFRIFRFPPSLLDLLWNKLHIFPIEWFIGDIDIFITSDWTEPPVLRAKKATILYDLIVYKYPKETHKKIIETQKRKLAWVKKESDIILCISEFTKKDAILILGIEEERLKVVYPGT